MCMFSLAERHVYPHVGRLHAVARREEVHAVHTRDLHHPSFARKSRVDGCREKHVLAHLEVALGHEVGQAKRAAAQHLKELSSYRPSCLFTSFPRPDPPSVEPCEPYPLNPKICKKLCNVPNLTSVSPPHASGRRFRTPRLEASRSTPATASYRRLISGANITIFQINKPHRETEIFHPPSAPASSTSPFPHPYFPACPSILPHLPGYSSCFGQIFYKLRLSL